MRNSRRMHLFTAGSFFMAAAVFMLFCLPPETKASDNYFAETLTINPVGYLLGDANDTFYMGSGFLNYSNQNTLWDTDQAMVVFYTGASSTHQFLLAGADVGASSAGLTNNFAWGTLTIASGNSLTLGDGNTGNTGSALYVAGAISGLVLSGTTVTNITGGSGCNVYYVPAGNPGLTGKTYGLTGGGYLVPVCDTALPGDFPLADSDVDGSDLAKLIANSGLLDPATFAQNFGKNTCP